eukprot:4116505-Pyramimonas_sp.AAC.2
MGIGTGMGSSSAMQLRVSSSRPELLAPPHPTRCRQTSTSRSSSSVKWRTATHDNNNIANPSENDSFQLDPRVQKSSRVRLNGGAPYISGLGRTNHINREVCALDRGSSTGASSTFSLIEDILSVCTTPTDISLAFGPETIEAPSGEGLLGSSHVVSLYSMQLSHSRATPPPPTIASAPLEMSAAPSAPPGGPGAGPPSPEDNRGKADDFYVNVGDAIRTLRRELPTIFHEDLTCKYSRQTYLNVRH